MAEQQSLAPGFTCTECGAPVEAKVVALGEPVELAPGVVLYPPDRLTTNVPCGHDAEARWVAEWCNALQPGSSKRCERPAHGDDVEHRTTLTPRRTYSWWLGDSTPVHYRVGSVDDPEVEYGPPVPST